MTSLKSVLYVFVALFVVALAGGAFFLSPWSPSPVAAHRYLRKAESVSAEAYAKTVPYTRAAAAMLPDGKSTVRGAVRASEAIFKAYGLSKDEYVNLGTDLVGAVIQAMTLGLFLSAVAIAVRWFEKRRRRRFLGAQIWSDYRQVLDRLLKIHDRFAKSTKQGVDYLSFMLIALERQVERLESRSSEFGDIVEVAAREHFDAAVNVLDTLFDFTTSARLWNDSATEKSHDPFYVLGDESFVDLNNSILAFLDEIGSPPPKEARERAVADANSLEEVKGAFLGGKKTAAPELSVAA